jgi:phosphoglycerol transferase MdoB-like AlkP superfamily enzyme
MASIKKQPWRRARFLAAAAAIYGVICLAQRLSYALWVRAEDAHWPQGLAMALAKGFVFDAVVAAWLFLPIAAVFTFMPVSWQERRFGRVVTVAFTMLSVVVGLLSISFEFFFWEEFHARYNFIAVDYLVYTHEVVRNIWESYHVAWFFLGLFFVLGLIAWSLSWRVRRLLASKEAPRERGLIGICVLMLLSSTFLLNQDRWLENDSVWARELSKNSLYSLFSAYNTNEIDYRQFYISLDQNEAERITSTWLRGGASGPAASPGLSREILGKAKEKRWNIMLVGIESMSARFLSHFGSKKHLTPNLDRMADEGLFFTHLYATGTRTVRGLEALMLSLPPTPGQSILRRPNSGDLFNLGWIFKQRGYDTQFLYGGYGQFDNMGPWFSSNGFQIVDKGEFSPGGIHFSTAWGACDEDLFDESIRRADASYFSGKHFFQMLMTTSNHRPYDFPDGRIDIKSHTGRDGAIKYTDYAIGRFVEEARKKPWFKETVFVFVADHNASVAGGTEIPIRDYLIPLIIYNPALITAEKIDQLASQIDVGPTLLGLLGFSYRSWFFGQDLLKTKANRALLGTYQKVALLEPGRLTILEPNRRAQVQNLDPHGEVREVQEFTQDPWTKEVRRAASIYQSASEVFTKGLSKVSQRAGTAWHFL